MNSCELVTFITAVSCSIAKCYPKEDLPLLIAVFSELAATLATIIEQEERTASVTVPVEVPVISDITYTL